MVYATIQNFLWPNTLQVKIWGAPTYGGKVNIPSNFSITIHNYTKNTHQAALLGICLKENEKDIFNQKG